MGWKYARFPLSKEDMGVDVEDLAALARQKVFFEKSGHKTDNDVQVFGICILSGLQNMNLCKTGSFTEIYLLSSGPGGTTE